MSGERMLLEKKRFVSLLEIVRREGELLLRTDGRLFTSTIDANWARQLEYDDDLAERLDAFVSRFGRMQDTLGDKLLPSLLRLLAEKTGSALDNLNKAEKLGLLASVMQWSEMRFEKNTLAKAMDGQRIIERLWCIPSTVRSLCVISAIGLWHSSGDFFISDYMIFLTTQFPIEPESSCD